MKTDYRLVFLSLLLLIFAGCHSQNDDKSVSHSRTVYDRVINSGTIRCGYVSYPPGFMKDPNTGKTSGVFVDIMEAAAKNLNLKINWTEEVGWGNMIEGLRSDRYDMVCSPVWANSTRARLADFGPPIYYSPIGAYVRTGNKQFVGNLEKVNDAKVKIATIDGEMSSIIAESEFPKAQVVSLPQLSDDSQLLLNVQSGRADVTFVEPYIASLYLKNNPGSVENIIPERPIRFFPTTVMFKKDEEAFKSMISVALEEQINSGALDRAFEKYNVPAGFLLKPASPYQSGSQISK